ncbi:MAG: hypothetical protein M4579_006162 [Chaenotheca gracillima]|nr:MAG: hypothetical protein M4579_006162 [Chaenotheca gracillima]
MTDADSRKYERNALVNSIDRDGIVDLWQGYTIANGPVDFPFRKRVAYQSKASLHTISKSGIGSSRLQKRALERQSNAPWQLIDLSYPPYGDPLGDETQFVYNSVAGGGSTIYFVETGVNGLNPDYRNRPKPATSTVRYPPGRMGDKLQPEVSGVLKDSDGRGSCSISLASGISYGVAKKANVILYQIPQTIEGKPSLSTAVLLNALNMILLDVWNTKRQKSVLVIPWAIKNPLEMVYFRTQYQEIFHQLTNLGMVITIGSGNGGGSSSFDDFPALLASPAAPMIVVGASDKTGHAAEWSQNSPPISLLAPGSDIICASNLNESFQTTSGTGYSASLVGGLAAYLLTHPYYAKFLEPTEPHKVEQIPEKMANLIRQLAWTSHVGEPGLAFNGAEWFNEVAGPDCDPSLSDPHAATAPSDVPRQRRKRSCPRPTSSAPPILPKPQPSSPPLPPPHSSSPSPPPPPQPPPGKNCGYCGDACLVPGATCVAACLLPPQSSDAPNKCSDCMAEAKASAHCITCWQDCRNTMPDGGPGGFDCSNENYFRTCKGYTKEKWLGEDTGLCTQPGGYALYEANPGKKKAPCILPQVG